MSRDEILSKMQEIFRENFDDDSLVITDVTSAADIEEWDSLEQMYLIETIQSSFNIQIPVQDAFALRNVGDLVEGIFSKKYVSTK